MKKETNHAAYAAFSPNDARRIAQKSHFRIFDDLLFARLADDLNWAASVYRGATKLLGQTRATRQNTVKELDKNLAALRRNLWNLNNLTKGCLVDADFQGEQLNSLLERLRQDADTLERRTTKALERFRRQRAATGRAPRDAARRDTILAPYGILKNIYEKHTGKNISISSRQHGYGPWVSFYRDCLSHVDPHLAGWDEKHPTALPTLLQKERQ